MGKLIDTLEVSTKPEDADGPSVKPPKEANSDSEDGEGAADLSSMMPVWTDHEKKPPLNFQEFLSFGRRMRESEFTEYRRQFGEYADPRTGEIRSEGLPAVLNGLGYTALPEMVAELLSHADHDGSGAIEFEEFVELMAVNRAQDG